MIDYKLFARDQYIYIRVCAHPGRDDSWSPSHGTVALVVCYLPCPTGVRPSPAFPFPFSLIGPLRLRRWFRYRCQPRPVPPPSFPFSPLWLSIVVSARPPMFRLFTLSVLAFFFARSLARLRPVSSPLLQRPPPHPPSMLWPFFLRFSPLPNCCSVFLRFGHRSFVTYLPPPAPCPAPSVHTSFWGDVHRYGVHLPLNVHLWSDRK